MNFASVEFCEFGCFRGWRKLVFLWRFWDCLVGVSAVWRVLCRDFLVYVSHVAEGVVIFRFWVVWVRLRVRLGGFVV